MKISKVQQQHAVAKTKTARLETRIKAAGNQRLKLLGLIAEKLLNDGKFNTLFNNTAASLLSYSDLQLLDLVDRYGNNITDYWLDYQ